MAAPKGNQYAKGKATGRIPTFDNDRIEEEANALLEWIANDSDDKIYLGSFAKMRGYPRQKLSMFAESNKVFRDAYEQAKDWQELKFIQNGLNRKWDSGFTQYVMARVCRPEWKKTWDAAEEQKEQAPSTIIINKIEK